MENKTKEIFILNYFPKKIQEKMDLSPEERIVSQFVYDFKEGHRPISILAAKLVAQAINTHFNLENEKVLFTPIPASNRQATHNRYNLFSYLVSEKCNVIDGHKLVNNWVETEQKHLSQNHAIKEENNRWFVKYSEMRKAKVIVFDDILTTGDTAAKFTRRLESCGAKVIGKVFLAKTINLKQHLQDQKYKIDILPPLKG